MTTPHQNRPEGAYTVGGGEFRFGQQVDEAVITDLFQIELPSRDALKGVGIKDLLTGDFDVASQYLGRALGTLPFDSLKQFEKIVLEPTDEDPDPYFVDKEDGINKILDSFGLKKDQGDLKDLWDKIRALIKSLLGGGDGDTEDVKDRIDEILDGIRENLETVNEMTALGNRVVSPNFEFPSVNRFPYGTPTWAYTTDQKRMGFRSLSFTTTAANIQGMYLSPSQRRNRFIVRPGLYSDSGLNIKAKSTNGTAGNVSLRFRWYDGDTFLWEDSTVVQNSNAALKSGWYDLELEAKAPDNADGLEMFVVASADSQIGNTYYLDAAFLRDKTRLQKVIEDIWSALNGGTGSGKVFDGLRAFFEKAQETQDTIEGMNSPGNRLLAPNFEATFIKRFPYGTPAPTVDYSTEQTVLGIHSLKWITTAAAVQGVYMNPTQKTTKFSVQPGVMFNCFAKVRGFSTNSTGTTKIVMRWTNFSGGVLSEVTGTTKNNSDTTFKSSWVDFEVTGVAPTDATGLEVFIVSSADTAIGSKFYVDAAAVQEKTVAQKIVDQIHQAIDGAVAARNERVETVKDKLQTAWSKFVDGLRGHTSGTTEGALPADVYNAAAGVKAAADTAQTSADVANANASEAAVIAQEAQEVVITASHDYSNIAAGSNFETWSDGWPNYCIQPWEISDSRWSVNTAHITGDPGGYMDTLPEDPYFVDSPYGHCLQATPGSVVTYATLKTQPTAIVGEQFYIEFMARRDSFFNGTDSLSRLRIGYNDEDIYLDSIPYGTTSLPTADTWVKFSKTITAPPGSQYLTFTLGSNGSATNNSIYNAPLRNGWSGPVGIGLMGRVYIDNVVIKRLVPPDGVELLPQTKVNNLQINMAAVAAYRGANLLTNGSFEDSNFLIPEVIGLTGASYSTTRARTGTQSVKLDTAIYGPLGWSRMVSPLDPLGSGQVYVPCSSSDVFYVECWIWADTANSYPGSNGFAISIWPESQADVADTTSPSSLPVGAQRVTSVVGAAANGAWTKVSGVFSPPPGVTGFFVALEGQGTNCKWWVDDVALYRTTEAAVAQAAASAASTVASAAQTTATTAQSSATTASTNLQTTIDGIAQSVDNNGVTGQSASSAKTKLLRAWSAIFDGLNGTVGSSTKTPTDVYSAAAAVTSQASSAYSTAGAASSVASDASTKINNTNNALFGANVAGSAILSGIIPNLAASKITSGKLSSSVLPTGTGAIGSGFLVRKTSGTINVSCSPNTVSTNKFNTSSFDSTPSGTSDYSVSTGGGGELKVTASNAGWYMVEVCFGIKQQTRAVGYRIAPMIFLNGNAHKVGSTVDYVGSFNAQIPFAAQASFIVYLNSGDYVTPGAVMNSQSTISALDIIGTNFNQDTYFSVSLLNRSLA